MNHHQLWFFLAIHLFLFSHWNISSLMWEGLEIEEGSVWSQVSLQIIIFVILLCISVSTIRTAVLNTSTLKESPTFASLICYSDSRTVQGHLLLPHLSIEQEKSRNGANSDHLTCYASILLFLIKLFNILLSMTNWKMKYHWSLAKEHL